MKLALVICGDGRGEYLELAMKAIGHITTPITARLMIDDSGDSDYGLGLEDSYPEFDIRHTNRAGMAGAVQAGFDLALEYDPDYVVWVEEDMLLTRSLPVAAAVEVLENHPELAQMTFPREVWGGNGAEVAAGSQLGAILAQANYEERRELYCAHDFIFSLNPCLIPARILRLGWDINNEAGMTEKLRDRYLFGAWGHPGGPTFARHIGTQRSAGWRL